MEQAQGVALELGLELELQLELGLALKDEQDDLHRAEVRLTTSSTMDTSNSIFGTPITSWAVALQGR